MKLLLVLLSIAFSSLTFAGDSSSGCGLGWQVLPKQSLVSSFTRSLINATFSNTIAMTLGTSGCARHSIVYNEKKGIHFVEANKNELMIEMAQGQGEVLMAMGEVFGCTNGQDFGSLVQKNYEKIVPSSLIESAELYQNLKSEIIKDANLSKTCTVI